MKKAKVIISGADNGFIINIRSHGMSSYQEPYEPELLVALDFKSLELELKKLFGIGLTDKEKMTLAASRLSEGSG